MLFESYFIWYFRGFNDGNSVITYMSLLSSMLLFVVVTGLLIYYPRIGLIIGLIALAGVFPFGIRWLMYRCTMEGPIIHGAQNQIVLLATVLFVIGLSYSLKRIITYNSSNNVIILKQPLKLVLAFFPAFVLLVLIILSSVNP